MHQFLCFEVLRNSNLTDDLKFGIQISLSYFLFGCRENENTDIQFRCF